MPSVSTSAELDPRVPPRPTRNLTYLFSQRPGIWVISAQRVTRTGAQKKAVTTWVHIFLDPP